MVAQSPLGSRGLGERDVGNGDGACNDADLHADRRAWSDPGARLGRLADYATALRPVGDMKRRATILQPSVTKGLRGRGRHHAAELRNGDRR